MNNKDSGISTETAENIAIEGIKFLAEDPERLGRFLAVTGLGPQNLRAAAAEPAFLCSVLEFLMGDEDLLLVFVERLRIRPTLIAAARLKISKGNGDEPG